MYRIWIGLDGKVALGCVLGAVGLIVAYMHFWAFGALGFPGHLKTAYPQYTAPPPAAAPVR